MGRPHVIAPPQPIAKPACSSRVGDLARSKGSRSRGKSGSRSLEGKMLDSPREPFLGLAAISGGRGGGGAGAVPLLDRP